MIMDERKKLRKVLIIVGENWQIQIQKLERKLRNAGIEVQYAVSKTAGEEPSLLWKEGEIAGKTSDLQQEMVVITDDPRAALWFSGRRIACIGCAGREQGYFAGTGFVTEAPELLEVYELEEYLFHVQGWPVTVAKTERLVLREIVKEDWEILWRISRQEGMKYLYQNGDREFFRRDNLLAYIEQAYALYGFGLWGVCLRDGTLIGCCGLSPDEGYGITDACGLLPDEGHGETDICGENRCAEDQETCLELQYMLSEEYQRQGYGREMCLAVLDFAKERQLADKVWIKTHPENTASVHLAISLGFTFEGKTAEGYLQYRMLLGT